jgi:hypothetical protein
MEHLRSEIEKLLGLRVRNGMPNQSKLRKLTHTIRGELRSLLTRYNNSSLQKYTREIDAILHKIAYSTALTGVDNDMIIEVVKEMEIQLKAIAKILNQEYREFET